MQDPNRPQNQPFEPPKEGEGLGWKHPYVWYVILTGVLFAGLLIAGWAAWNFGWLPTR